MKRAVSLRGGWEGTTERHARAYLGRATIRSARLMHPYCRDGEHRVGAVTQRAHCAPTLATYNPIAGSISTALVLPQGRRIARDYHGGSFERLPSQARGPRYLQSFSVLEGPPSHQRRVCPVMREESSAHSSRSPSYPAHLRAPATESNRVEWMSSCIS